MLTEAAFVCVILTGDVTKRKAIFALRFFGAI